MYHRNKTGSRAGFLARRARGVALALIAAASTLTCNSGDGDRNAVLPTEPGTPGAPGTPGTPANHPRRITGVAEVTFRDVAGQPVTSDVIAATSVAEFEAQRATRTGPTTSISAGLGFELGLIAAGSFSSSPNGSPTHYVRATYGLRVTSDNAGFDRTRENLTFIAIASATTIDQTPVRSLLLDDGSPASSALAGQLTPTSLLADNGAGGVIDLDRRVLRTLTPSQADSLRQHTGVTNVFPYGFAVLNAPADLAPFQGVVTFAFSMPERATRAVDPGVISILLLIVTNATAP